MADIQTPPPRPRNTASGCATIIAVFTGIIIVLFLVGSFFGQSSTDDTQTNVNHNGVYHLYLTKGVGRTLPKPAIFYIDTKSTIWTLDYQNGTKIDYTIISGKSDDPLCGISAVDSKGDKCEICVTPLNNRQAKVTFSYGKMILPMEGDFR